MLKLASLYWRYLVLAAVVTMVTGTIRSATGVDVAGGLAQVTGAGIGAITGLTANLIPDSETEVRVVRVVDGDTFVASIDGDRQKIRIVGVNTPESKKPNTPVECYAKKAASFTTAKLEGKNVKLTYGVDREDKYGRTLAYVEKDGKDFGLSLIKRGYARTMTIAPNVSRAAKYQRAQKKAKDAGKGLWGSCQTK